MNPMSSANPLVKYEYENAMAALERLNPAWAIDWRGIVGAAVVIVIAICMVCENFSTGQITALFSGLMAASLYWRYFPCPDADQKRWQEAMKAMQAMNEQIKNLRAAQPH
jgi:hypothetical protein